MNDIHPTAFVRIASHLTNATYISYQVIEQSFWVSKDKIQDYRTCMCIFLILIDP